jgi:hypothetical protein
MLLRILLPFSWSDVVYMEQLLLQILEKGKLVCSVCKLVIPFVPQKGPEYTCTSFTLVEEKPICYWDYHPEDYEKIRRKKVTA